LHLKYVPLPGGDASVKKPNRMAMAHLWAAGLAWPDRLAASELEARVVRRQLESATNCVATSSMGRLFDAFAALIGVQRSVTYEAQAAIEMEALAEGVHANRGYRFSFDRNTFDPAPLFRAALDDLRSGVPAAEMAAAFHMAVAELMVECCEIARQRTGIATVALSGGVFQNTTLLGLATGALERAKFEVLTHRKVPPNDGGLALGQAAIGRRKLCESRG
jgi:hydrogenase maturation protein HypF